MRSAAVAVGMPVTQHPPHRSRRAALPHRAPASGRNAQAHGGACRTRLSACARRPRRCVRLLVCSAPFPLASSLPSTFSAAPWEQPLFDGFLGTMKLSDSLHPCITVVPLGFTVRTWHHCQARCRASRVPYTVCPCLPEVSDPARAVQPSP